MIEKDEKDFSETEPFKRTAFLKTRIWGPFWLFNAKGLFSGILLLIVGVFYFIWALIKNKLILYPVLVFCLPGIYLIIKFLKSKEKKNLKNKDIIDA
ncbi:MAG: hypothetical protein CMD20_04825 [Flavobacteriales bacterium]|nr:hypothetical protein [Flavobacteriales bacterium]